MTSSENESQFYENKGNTNISEICHSLTTILVNFDQFRKNKSAFLEDVDMTADQFIGVEKQQIKQIEKQMEPFIFNEEIIEKKNIFKNLVRLHLKLLLFNPKHYQEQDFEDLSMALTDAIVAIQKEEPDYPLPKRPQTVPEMRQILEEVEKNKKD